MLLYSPHHPRHAFCHDFPDERDLLGKPEGVVTEGRDPFVVGLEDRSEKAGGELVVSQDRSAAFGIFRECAVDGKFREA